jgi:hypothetical protein
MKPQLNLADVLMGRNALDPGTPEWWANIRRGDPRFSHVDNELAATMPGYVWNGILGTEQPYAIEESRSRVIHPDSRPWRGLPQQMHEDGSQDAAPPPLLWPYGMAP